MADIIDSRDYDLYELMVDFKGTTELINHLFAADFISPITITLGDEFQCVFDNVHSALKIVFEIEEELIKSNSSYKLRYIVYEGQIETSINRASSYEMMGRGLIEAREKLVQVKSKKDRFHFYLKNDEKNEALFSAFINFQDYVDGWRVKADYPTVSEFLKVNDYKAVAGEMNKTASQIWKRKKSLKIDQYTAIKKVIEYIGRGNSKKK